MDIFRAFLDVYTIVMALSVGGMVLVGMALVWFIKALVSGHRATQLIKEEMRR